MAKSRPDDLLYMHTIDGKPGYFDGDQIVYAEDRSQWRDEYAVCVLRRSERRQIYDEQAKSTAFRASLKWDIPEYGFVIVGTRKQILPPPE